MTSFRAQIIKAIFRGSRDNTLYDVSTIELARKRFDRTLSAIFPASSHKVVRCIIAGTYVDVIETSRDTGWNVMYLHGGGFVMGSTKSYRQHLKRISKLCSAKVYAVDYSLAPEAPYPKALNEIQRVWEALVSDEGVDPQTVTFMGDSAGANLAVVSALRFRDSNINLPASLVLLSPFLDLTLSGKSHETNAKIDPMLNRQKVEFFADAYAGAADKNGSYVSPIFASLKDLPPMLVHASNDEILLSDARTIVENAQRDGTDATLYIGEGMWHGWHLFAAYVPEAKRAMRQVTQFVTRHS